MHTINEISKKILLIFGLIIAILSRLIPHPPNVNAMNSIVLLFGVRFNQRMAMLATLLLAIASDALLAYGYGYSLIGSWSWFTLSAYLGISQLAKWISSRQKWQWIEVSIFASCLFWLWTNFGTWLTSDMYPHSISGLGACYVAALPFLLLAVIGDVVWMTVIIYGFSNSKMLLKRISHV